MTPIMLYSVLIFSTSIAATQTCEQPCSDILYSNLELTYKNHYNKFLKDLETTKETSSIAKTSLKALESRLSTSEFNQASMEENNQKAILELKKELQIEFDSKLENLKTEILKGSNKVPDNPFKNLDGWTKIDNPDAHYLYYKPLHAQIYNWGAAFKACKDLRKDAQLGQVMNASEKAAVEALTKGKNYHLAGINSFNPPNNVNSYIWLPSGKPVDASLFHGSEGTSTGNAITAIYSGQVFHDWDRWQVLGAVCELRLD